MTSLLYVSEATHRLPEGNDLVAAIVTVAQARNPALEITGALIFTGAHFAQILEGPEASIEALMENIGRDERHRGIDVVETRRISKRRFADWSLAYAGPSLFIDRHIRPLVEKRIAGGRETIMAAQLVALMREFTQD
ncbi:MAG: BLUF domain-containing protein [Pseudomonadota bacterium]|nr:BLUF domain-containing protein [Pseudomonadota bacterium]